MYASLPGTNYGEIEGVEFSDYFFKDLSIVVWLFVPSSIEEKKSANRVFLEEKVWSVDEILHSQF